MNLERFHNRLALRLGRERIVSERRLSIHVDDKCNPDDPWVTIEVKGTPQSIGFYSSDEPGDDAWQKMLQKDQMAIVESLGIGQEIQDTINAAHQAYLDANKGF